MSEHLNVSGDAVVASSPGGPVAGQAITPRNALSLGAPRRQRNTKRLPPSASASSTRLRSVPFPPSAEPAPFRIVGRDAELRILDEAVERLVRSGGAVAIYGDPGTGKSALLEAARSRACSRDYLVITATGAVSETTWPFAGLHQLIAPLLDEADALPRPQHTAMSAAFGIEETAAVEPFLVGLAALNLLTTAAARRPVVVIVDDIQWLDSQTQDVLTFISRRVSRDRVLIVGAVRGNHVGSFVGACGCQIEVGGLDDLSARELLERHGQDLDASDRENILIQANGNPLALVEMPAVWRLASAPTGTVGVSPVPLSARLERALAVGLDDVPAQTRDLLLVAAVGPDESTAEILAATGVLAGTDVSLDVLDPAVDAGVLRFDQARMQFPHPLARLGVLQAESPQRRQAAHRALAHVLIDDPVRSTWHRAQATVGFDDEVADELEKTHMVSVHRGSVRAGIAALERAAQLTTDPALRGRRLLLAAEQAFGLGRADKVDRLVSAASRHVLSEHDVARSQWLREIFNDGIPGDAPRVTELCDLARRAADGGDVDLALNLLMGASLRCWWAEAGQIAPRLVAGETQRLIDAQHDPRYIAALAIAEPIRQSRRVHELLTRFNPESVTDADALRLLGQAAHAIGEPVRAIDFLDRAELRLREQGRLGLLAQVLTMSAGDRMELGDWGRMTRAADEAQRLTRETGQPNWATSAIALNAMVAGLCGDPDHAEDLAAEAARFADERRLNYLLCRVQLARSSALISSGQYVQAYAALRRLFDPADPCHHSREKFRGVMYLAAAAVRANQVPDARALLGRLEEIAGATPSPALHGQLGYARAVLADDDHAEDLYRTALDADLVRWPLIRAQLQLAFGSWLRRQRRPVESREPLRSAWATLAAIGARSWCETARRELRAAGEITGRDSRPPAHALLSAQELQVARLVAEGLSNKQIGERLYLSPRTIGSHLYRIFPKLDITSRGQMSGRLHSG